jgi:hypothetical protein
VSNSHTEFLVFLRPSPPSFSRVLPGKYCGGKDAKLDRINVFYHGASGDKYMSSTVLFDLEPGVIDAMCASPLG